MTRTTPNGRLRVFAAPATPTGAAVRSAVLIAMVLAPTVNLWRTAPRDSFPLSHYPMFSSRRSELIDVAYLRGTDESGNHVVLDSRLAGAGGMNQQRKQLARAARRAQRAERIAARAAKRVAKRTTLQHVTAVELVVGTFAIADHYATGRPQPRLVRVAAAAPVRRPSSGDEHDAVARP